MVAQHLQRHALLGHRHDRLLVHVRIVDAHAAEDRERLHKVLIVARKVQPIELVHQLNDADNLAERILDRHAQNVPVLEQLAVVDARIEPMIGVRIVNVHRFAGGRHVTGDANVDGEARLERTAWCQMID